MKEAELYKEFGPLPLVSLTVELGLLEDLATSTPDAYEDRMRVFEKLLDEQTDEGTGFSFMLRWGTHPRFSLESMNEKPAPCSRPLFIPKLLSHLS